MDRMGRQFSFREFLQSYIFVILKQETVEKVTGLPIFVMLVTEIEAHDSIRRFALLASSVYAIVLKLEQHFNSIRSMFSSTQYKEEFRVLKTRLEIALFQPKLVSSQHNEITTAPLEYDPEVVKRNVKTNIDELNRVKLDQDNYFEKLISPILTNQPLPADV